MQFEAVWEHIESAFMVFKTPEDIILDIKEVIYGLHGTIVPPKSPQ